MQDTAFSSLAQGAHTSRGVLVHVAGPAEGAGLAAALRSAGNAVAALVPGVPVEVVVQGPGVGLLAVDSALAEPLRDAGSQGIMILACGNSLRSAELTPGQLLPGVGTVPAAIAHAATRQWEGWAYVRL